MPILEHRSDVVEHRLRFARLSKFCRGEHVEVLQAVTKYDRFFILMGKEFILLTRGYGFMGGCPPPFDTLKIGTSTDDIKLKLYR